MRHGLARMAAVAAAVLATVLLAIAFVTAASLGWRADDLADHGLLSIPLLVAGFTSAGTILAWHRPRNAIGWLMLSTGLLAAVTAWSIPATVRAAIDGWPVGVQQTLATVSYTTWTVWLVLIPMTLLLFPAGRIKGALTTTIAIAIVVSGSATLLLTLADPGINDLVAELGAPADGTLLASGSIAALGDTVIATWLPLLPAVFAIEFAVFLSVVVVLAVRFIQGDAGMRRQLFWILLAALLIVVLATTSTLSTVVGPAFGMLALLPLPIGIMIAILRVNLFNVELVFSRALAWTILTTTLIAVFFGLVALLGTLLVQTASAVIAALAVALAFDPLRRWLQRFIDRLIYGRRSEPVYLVELLGSGISRASDIQSLIEQLRGSLKLGWLAVRDDEKTVAADGVRSESVVSWSLRQDDAEVGTLEVCPRNGEHTLNRFDREALTLLSPVLAMLLRVTSISQELAVSRGRIVEATEDERRRLQRDLHDGVASALGGIAFKIEGIRNRVRDSPDAAVDLLASVHADIVRASGTLREVIHDLRPPELDTLGLVGALREATSSLRERPVDRSARVTVRSEPEPLILPAAIEVATYRIGVEAVANALRHSAATEVTIDLELRPTTLSIRVRDNAKPTHKWTAGVGLHSMRERTELLGGSFSAGPSATGGTVDVAIPLHTAAGRDG